jgi:hypothetical protein
VKTRPATSSYLPALITGIAVILFSSAGVARMMGWGPNSTDASGDTLALEASALAPLTDALPRLKCAECGVVVSTRKIESREYEFARGEASDAVTSGSRRAALEKSAARYEVVVRMTGGTHRVIEESHAATWRTGEQLMIIGGPKPSMR